PITPSDVGLTDEAAGCFNLYRVNWKKSFLSADGARMLCWYQAPDAESARIALRRLKANTEGVWAGTVVGGDDPGAADATASSFTAELRFSAPFSAEALDALAAALRQDDVM